MLSTTHQDLPQVVSPSDVNLQLARVIEFKPYFNARSKRIEYVDESESEPRQTYRAKGVHTCLNKIFGPMPNWSKKNNTARTKICTSRSRMSALERGRLVDRQLSAFVHSKGAVIPAHPWSRKILRRLHLEQLRPLNVAQVPVLWPGRKLGTMCDMLCVDQDANMVLIEIKTGFANFRRAPRRLTKCFRQFAHSPQNRALLQLELTRFMFYKQFGIRVANKRCLVLHCNDIGTTIVKLSEWTSDVVNLVEENYQLRHVKNSDCMNLKHASASQST